VNKKEQLVCGVDIGTTKICTVVGRARSGAEFEVLGTGYAESAGLKKGVVVDMEQASASIRKAAEEAENNSGTSLDMVICGLSGDHVRSYNCHGAIPIESRQRQVTAEDMEQVVHAAQSIPTQPGRETIHVLAQEFFVDGRGEILNPVGLTGSRLEVDVHVVTCDSSVYQNQINAVNRAQMRVRKVVLQQLASAEAVLTRDEKDLGSAVIDIGGGTTDIAVYHNGSIRFTGVIPVGGMHFTRDVAVGLRTPVADAERLKKELGTVAVEGVAEDELVDAPGVASKGLRQVPRIVMARILQDRANELLELVRDEIARAGCTGQLVSGAVITGGGSLLDGMVEAAEEILQVPVRPGLPQGLTGLSNQLSHPVYATAIGLALLGTRETGDPSKKGPAASSPWLVGRILGWVGGQAS
jgi:cell division protein FtsA